MSDQTNTAVNPLAGIAVNPLQSAALLALIAAFQTTRNLAVTVRAIANNLVTTVSGYAIAASSVCVEILGADGNVLPDFCAIECKRTGRFALPSIRSYREGNVPNTLQPYPMGATAFDAVLFADSHVRKQNGAWLRRSPQAATAVIASAVSVAPSVPAPPTVPDAKPDAKPAKK